ncbi:MAG: transglutaminase-like domain-containing protein, partial [Deltaproteobacteria bacterium]
MKRLVCCLIICITFNVASVAPSPAESFNKLAKPPLNERWFGIYVDTERVGFYRQNISETAEGYRMEADGSVRLNVMGFSKVASSRESYLVGKNLAIRSFEVEQTINGNLSRISGKVSDTTLKIKSESNGKTSDRQLKFTGDVYPGTALNLYPLMREIVLDKPLKVLYFDPEEVKLREVTITVLGEGKLPDGKPALKLRNNIYPFVNNDILMDLQGNTVMESVREGLVTTKAEDPKALGAFVGGIALTKKDLIYDFSLVRAEPPIRDLKKLTGMVVEISGWNDGIPLLQEGGQFAEKSGAGRIIVKTGSAVLPLKSDKPVPLAEAFLLPAEKIESDAPEIMAKAKEIAAIGKNTEDKVKLLASWTADWLNDTVDDKGGALASFKSRNGNCQTHSRLYTALARAAGIPTRFVSGLVYQDGKGFLYHSWAESLTSGAWTAVDPTYA